MSTPRYTPSDGYYFDDPSEKMDPVDPAKAEQDRIRQMASHVLTRFGEWITRGKKGRTNRAFRSDIVVYCVTPQYIPAKRPSAAWVGLQHGRSRQRAGELERDFRAYADLPKQRKIRRKGKAKPSLKKPRKRGGSESI